jgi:hypothetical protein
MGTNKPCSIIGIVFKNGSELHIWNQFSRVELHTSKLGQPPSPMTTFRWKRRIVRGERLVISSNDCPNNWPSQTAVSSGRYRGPDLGGVLAVEHGFDGRGVPLRAALGGRYRVGGQLGGDDPQRRTASLGRDDAGNDLARQRRGATEPHTLSLLDRQRLTGALRDKTPLQLD